MICLLISVFVEYSALTVTCLAQLELEDNTMVAHYYSLLLYTVANYPGPDGHQFYSTLYSTVWGLKLLFLS